MLAMLLLGIAVAAPQDDEERSFFWYHWLTDRASDLKRAHREAEDYRLDLLIAQKSNELASMHAGAEGRWDVELQLRLLQASRSLANRTRCACIDPEAAANPLVRRSPR